MKDVVVLSAVRSGIGSFNGALSSLEPADLASIVIKEAISRAGIDSKEVTFSSIGNCIPTESRSPYVSRVASIKAGMPMESVAVTVNRLCGSAMQGIVSTSQSIMLGDCDFGIGGGVEVMSRGGYLSPAMRSGARMGDTNLIDMMVATLTDPFGVGHMGITAENLAKKWDITREDQDNFSIISQKKAIAAMDQGRFKEQIVPIVISSRKGDITFETDEYPKRDTSQAKLAKMRPAFLKDGTVTAGNSSGINDGASFLVLADSKTSEKKGLEPIARLVSYGLAGVSNEIMGEGPIPASTIALKKAGLTLDKIDVIESNEAFAAQAIAVNKGLNLNSDITNINGGAIALGHPVGATGAILATKLIHELKRTNGKLGLATMCIGGGQGIATIYELL
jgi:acetyl-CoA C-acetyltransferase